MERRGKESEEERRIAAKRRRPRCVEGAWLRMRDWREESDVVCCVGEGVREGEVMASDAASQ